jgi:imidazoleglycerol-phosphate dehydratase/histidinol-phosphatase
MKKALFIDRDGSIIVEPPVDFQVDSLEKLEFVPKVIRNLHFIRKNLDFEFVMVTNQDGLGTASFPEDTFWPAQNKMLQTLKGEDITFDNVLIDKTFPEDNASTRKPRTGMLGQYLSGEYNLAGSFVIGDRLTDVELAKNLGCKALFLSEEIEIPEALKDVCVLQTADWDKISEFLFAGERTAEVKRTTHETDIYIYLNLDGSGQCDISTGLGFFDHMLEQIGKHAGTDLTVRVKGDLYVDEHHTIEDTEIALGDSLYKALGNKRGIERYGFSLPMDDCLCSVSLDFGGRAWLVWNTDFRREKIGDMPTEMFLHFFKSLSDAAKMNLNISAEGANEHHKIEGIFKAFAKAVKMAKKRDIFHFDLPSTKGML